MELRKILSFASAYGLTLPKPYIQALKINKGDHVEVYLRDNKTIVIKRHGVQPKGLTITD